MNFRPQKHDYPEVNLTSLIDIVFLLLIFFMVTTTFDRNTALKIDLPDATSAVQVQQDLIEIVIDKRGHFFIQNKELINTQAKTLAKKLASLIKDIEDPLISIRADAETPHQAVVTVMDVSGRLGLNRISIVAKKNTQ